MTSVLDEETAERIGAAGTPPCEIFDSLTGVMPCGAPSVARIRVQCGACPSDERVFICQDCLDMLRADGLECTDCGAFLAAWGYC